MAKKKPAKRKIKQADKPADGMRIEFVSVAELLPYAANARTHSPEQVKQIVDSILEFGFTNPVLIDANNELVAGHGRVMAAKELGHDLVPCIRLGHLTELQIRAYRLADNKIALNSGWDDSLLKAEIEALQKLDVDLQIAGFGADEIAKLIEGIKAPNKNVNITPTHEVIAECADEMEQQKVYQLLIEGGFKCRLSTF